MKNMTLINIIFDRSGSMAEIAEEIVGMFNRFLDEQKALSDYAEVSLFQFDDIYEENYIRKNIKDIPHLILGETYIPGGMTALFDAVGKTISKIRSELNSLPDKEKPERVLFVIVTDGHENASKEYNGASVKNLIEKENLWDFIFLAAGIDAFEEGTKFGMGFNKCASFDKSKIGIASAGAAMSTYATTYRAGGNAELK